MKQITVFADFDFLATPQEIGTLGYERVRGKDHFVLPSGYYKTFVPTSGKTFSQVWRKEFSDVGTKTFR